MMRTTTVSAGVRSSVMHIVYCDQCGKRVPVEELSETTLKSGATGKVFCAQCNSAQQKSFAPSPSNSHSRSISKTHEKIPIRKTAPDTKMAFVGGVATVVVAATLGLIFMSSKSAPPAPKSSGTAAKDPVEIVAPRSSPVAPPSPPSPPPPPARVAVVTPPPPPAKTPVPEPPREIAPPASDPAGDTPPKRAAESESPLDSIAAKYLADAKAMRATDPAGCKELLTRIVTTYRSTSSSAEAAKLLQDLKDNPPPPPPTPPAAETKAPAAELKDATPVFDGKSLACLDPDCISAWKVENGAIASINREFCNAQSRADYGDGVLHFRFENSAADDLAFEVRQGSGAQSHVGFGKAEIAAMAGKPHDLNIACDGANVTATLDGNAVNVTRPAGQPHFGRFRFSVDHGTLRVLAVEFQKLPAK